MAEPKKYENTLLGFFDIHAYSTFLQKETFEDVKRKIEGLFRNIQYESKTDIYDIKIDHMFLSDSIIIVLDTHRCPIFGTSLEVFFTTCSFVMENAMKSNLPVRGAIGGGYFYRNNDVIISSALVDGAIYEKEQDWLGAVLTPDALETIDLAKQNSQLKKPQHKIDLDSERYKSALGFGKIPWKDNESRLNKPLESYYIKPFDFPKLGWTEQYLPSYFRSESKKIKNSNVLYGFTKSK